MADPHRTGDIPRRALTAPSMRVLYDLLLRIESRLETREANDVALAADVAELKMFLAAHSDEVQPSATATRSHVPPRSQRPRHARRWCARRWRPTGSTSGTCGGCWNPSRYRPERPGPRDPRSPARFDSAGPVAARFACSSVSNLGSGRGSTSVPAGAVILQAWPAASSFLVDNLSHRSKTMRPFIIAFLAAALLTVAAHAIPIDGGPLFDASMQLAPTVAPLQVVTASPAPPAVPPQAALLMLVVLGLGFVSAFIRKIAPAIHFFQTPTGALTLALISAALGAGATGLTTYGFSAVMIAIAVMSAATSAVGSWNPSIKGSGDGAVLRSFVPLLFLAVALTPLQGCAAGSDGFRQAVTSVATTNLGAYHSLDVWAASQQKSLQQRGDAIGCREKPDATGCDALRAEHNAYRARYTTARKVLDQVQDQVELAAQGADAYDQGAAVLGAGGQPRDLVAWAAELLSFVPQVIKALTDLGLKIGVPVPVPTGGGNQ